MPETDIGQLTSTGLTGTIQDYKVSNKSLDVSGGKEFYWYNSNYPQYLGYYREIPELHQAINALALWTSGLGWTTESIREKFLLKNIRGWGEDTFSSICFNLMVTKKINGDAYAEIIRNENDTLINLKPLNPQTIRHVVDGKGMIVRYDEIGLGDQPHRPIKKQDMLHLCNNRLGNEIHGVSAIESVKWVIDARNEAMADWRRVLHRSTIRVLYVDIDNTSKLTSIKNEYATAIKKGEVLILPVKKGDAELVDYTAPPQEAFLAWIRYLESFFYQAVGVPRVILGGSAEFTEAGSKVGYLTFEPVYTREQRELEADLESQVGISVTFNRPPSLSRELAQSEEKNTGQTGFQNNETTAQLSRTE